MGTPENSAVDAGLYIDFLMVWLETTRCPIGGSRTWFTCPACGKCVAVIYGAGRLFGCRRRKRLPYTCQREAADDLAARRADRIRKRLGWRIGILNAPGSKPKNMHKLTYERPRAQHDAFVGVSLAGMVKKLGLRIDQLDDIDAWR